MAKRSQRRPLRNERDQAGCIWGLINIFDFRHGRSTRKMLSDRRRGNRQAIGADFSRTKLILPDSHVMYQDTGDGEASRILCADTVKTSVKKLMEEEMSKDQGRNKQMNDSEVGPKVFDADFGSHDKKHHKRRNKTSKKPNDFHLSDLDAAEDLKPGKFCEQVQNQKIVDNSDLEIIVQELCQIHQTSCSCIEHSQNDSSSDMQLDQAGMIDKEKLAAAIKVFIDQSLCKSKHSSEDGQIQQSREFMDALHRVSSNKDLLLKFLQDPNSLLVKQTKVLEETDFEKDPEINPLPRSDFSEEKMAYNSKTDDLINQKPRKFFRRRSKSQEHFPLTESEKFQSSSKIVILKPGPATLPQPDNQINVGSSTPPHYSTGNKVHGERSQFSFTEIKRKLKHAIKKERQDIAPDGVIHKSRHEKAKRHDFDKGVGGENVGWCSPNRNHFYMERFAKPSMSFKRGEAIEKPHSCEATANDYLKPRVSNIYVEAKKHLIEMLSPGNDDTELTRQKFPKSLGRILSFSDYSHSPSFSPLKDREESFANTPVKLSPRGPVHSAVHEDPHQLVEEDRASHPSPSKPISENQLCLPCENHKEKIEPPNDTANVPHGDQANLVEKIPSSMSDMIISKGPVEIEETPDTSYQEASEIPVASFESSTSGIIEDTKSGDAAEECDGDMLVQTPKMETFGESQVVSSPVASPSHSSAIKSVEDSEHCIDRTGRPSPVSVLDPIFAEDDISPARTISRPVELEILPRQIDFEEQRSCSDQGTCIQATLQDEESAFEYVEAVLLGSGLNWDEYLLRWLSSCPILDSVLYDEVELFSSRSRTEQKLLFDCTNEVLEEVCDRYFGSFIGMSGKKQSVRPIPRAMDLILEIWRGVEWHLLQHPPPQSLDQLVRKDMAKSRAWMDLRVDTENIGEEMEKAILEILVEDTVSSFICYTAEGNSDSSETQS